MVMHQFIFQKFYRVIKWSCGRHANTNACVICVCWIPNRCQFYRFATKLSNALWIIQNRYGSAGHLILKISPIFSFYFNKRNCLHVTYVRMCVCRVCMKRKRTTVTFNNVSSWFLISELRFFGALIKHWTSSVCVTLAPWRISVMSDNSEFKISFVLFLFSIIPVK